MKPLTRYELCEDANRHPPYAGMRPSDDGEWYAKADADARIRHYQDEALCAEEAAMSHAQRVAELERDLKTLAEASRNRIAELQTERDAARADAERNRVNAERYEWLRRCHWSDSPLCVVSVPKENTILGAYLPSGELLDAAIDDAWSKE